jgi:hypothetical protein
MADTDWQPGVAPIVRMAALIVSGFCGAAIAVLAYWATEYPTSDVAVKAHTSDALVALAVLWIAGVVVFALTENQINSARDKAYVKQSEMLERVIANLSQEPNGNGKVDRDSTTFRGQVIRFITDVRALLQSYREPVSDSDHFNLIMTYVKTMAHRYFAIKDHLDKLLGWQAVEPLRRLPLPMSKDAIFRVTETLEQLLKHVPADLPTIPINDPPNDATDA